ncbi:hypothetical protein C1A50_1557 [Paenibacillus polymyxa]|nr:hypothetical protein C1A50_1557 [Paenibacillus polymyxa]
MSQPDHNEAVRLVLCISGGLSYIGMLALGALVSLFVYN